MVKKHLIKASEVSQYHFCPISWILQRQGYTPEEEKTRSGKEKHILLGKEIDIIQRETNIVMHLRIMGVFLLLFSIALIIMGLIWV